MPRSAFRSAAAALLVATLAALGCGGDSGTSPENRFPDVAGSYRITGTFDAAAINAAFTGPLTITQPDRSTSALSGDVVVTVSGDISGAISGFSNGTVDRDGNIAFNVGGTDNGASWHFTGRLTGATLSGRHTLAGAAGSASGDWIATRQ